MRVLITGARGFVGRNLTENLKNIRDGKNRTRPHMRIDEIYEYDVENTAVELNGYCKKQILYLILPVSIARKIQPNSGHAILALLLHCWIC